MNHLPDRIGLSKEEILEICKGLPAVTPEVLVEVIEKNNARIFDRLDKVFKSIDDELTH